jgi:transposase
VRVSIASPLTLAFPKWQEGRHPHCHFRGGNRYLRMLFVQVAVGRSRQADKLERHGLKSWIEAAKKRLHHNVPAIALANKLARIAWAVLAKGRGFEATRAIDCSTQPA